METGNLSVVMTTCSVAACVRDHAQTTNNTKVINSSPPALVASHFVLDKLCAGHYADPPEILRRTALAGCVRDSKQRDQVVSEALH